MNRRAAVEGMGSVGVAEPVRRDGKFDAGARASLPETGPCILSVKRQMNASEYILRRDPAEFERLLASHGANVIESAPLSLNEIFLELVLQTRTQVLDGRLEGTFQKWYPGFRPEPQQKAA
jgi:hypothetical protein